MNGKFDDCDAPALTLNYKNMNTKTYRGKSAKEVLARVSRELGPDADIIDRRLLKGEDGNTVVEVTAAPRVPSIAAEETVPGRRWSLLSNKLFLWIIGFSGVVIVALVVAGIAFWPTKKIEAPIPAVPGEDPSIAVLHFENGTGEIDLDHWRVNIANILTTDLAQSRYLNVIRSDKIQDVLAELNQLNVSAYSSDILTKIAENVGASYLVSGRFMKDSDTYVLAMQLYDSRQRKLIATERVEGRSEESIFASVDCLTQKVKLNLNLDNVKLNNDVDKAISHITTKSIEALQLYISAKKLQSSGKYRSSIKAAEGAIELDPEFAMAYYLIGLNYSFLSKRITAYEYYSKALRYVERLPVRRRYEIESMLYIRNIDTFYNALDSYNNIIELYPNSIIAWNNSGIIYFWLEEIEKAIQYFERSAKISLIENPDGALLNLSIVADGYLYLGDFKKAVNTIEAVKSRYQAQSRYHQLLAEKLVYVGRLGEAKQELALVQAKKPEDEWNIDFEILLMILEDEIEEAERISKKLIALDNSDLQMIGFSKLASVQSLQGRFADAIESYSSLIKLCLKKGRDPLIYYQAMIRLLVELGRNGEALQGGLDAENYYFSLERKYASTIRCFAGVKCINGLLYLNNLELSKAEAIAQDLKELVSGSPMKYLVRYYYLLKGLIELQKENFRTAGDLLRAAYSVVRTDINNPIFLYHLARANLITGDLIEAEELFLLMLSRKFYLGGSYNLDYYVRSYYMLGKVYQAQGKTEKAIENYEKFLSFWGEADPELPEPDDARIQLAALK